MYILASALYILYQNAYLGLGLGVLNHYTCTALECVVNSVYIINDIIEYTMCVLWVGILVLVVVRRSALGSRNLLITDQVEDFILGQTLRSIPSNNIRSYKLIFQPFTPFIQTKKIYNKWKISSLVKP